MNGVPRVSISVVSHGQAALAAPLLAQLDALAGTYPLEIILTENLADAPACPVTFRHAAVTHMRNRQAVGYGANHNAAFRHATSGYFCALNPDVRFEGNPFEPLRAQVAATPGVAGPRVVSPAGTVEDSARQVPSLTGVLARHALRRYQPDYDPAVPLQRVDWLAGMCLMFDAGTFAALDGFDERFHMYCEDVDICLRAHLLGYTVQWVQEAVIVHDAQRGSRRSLRPLLWHLRSMFRLVNSRPYRSYMHKTSTRPASRE